MYSKEICQLVRTGMMKTEIAKKLGIHVSSVKRAVRKGQIVRVLLWADSHCGSNTGLTPPAYQYKQIVDPKSIEHHIINKWARLQCECWEWYIKTLNILQPIDRCFINGDAIDGNGKRSGGTELITTDRKKQVAMAIECIGQVRASYYSMTFGTPYHCGNDEDFESDIAGHFGCKIGGHEWESVNGCVFDLKHKQSNCINPSTGLFNEIRDNREWTSVGEQPKTNVLVRSHTHRFCIHKVEDVIGISTPSLQAYGTKFGARQCSRKVQFGLVALDVWPDGGIVEHIHIANLSEHKANIN
jgi:hypothetical protein